MSIRHIGADQKTWNHLSLDTPEAVIRRITQGGMLSPRAMGRISRAAFSGRLNRIILSAEVARSLRLTKADSLAEFAIGAWIPCSELLGEFIKAYGNIDPEFIGAFGRAFGMRKPMSFAVLARNAGMPISTANITAFFKGAAINEPFDCGVVIQILEVPWQIEAEVIPAEILSSGAYNKGRDWAEENSTTTYACIALQSFGVFGEGEYPYDVDCFKPEQPE